MTGRAQQKDDFLEGTLWRDAERSPLAGDLSARNYVRLKAPSGETAILMNAPPESDASTPDFVKMTMWLSAINLSVPAIHAADTGNGLLLLEDFGDNKVSDLAVANPKLGAEIYELALDLLIHIRQQSAPDLAAPDAGELVEMTRLAYDHYPGVRAEGLSGFCLLLETILDELLNEENSVSLRDFHAENLMWLPNRRGLMRLGVLDYQDAFITHPVYDLVSLLTDARVDIAPEFRSRMIDEYAARTGDDIEGLRLAFVAFSAQRNLRILGVFARAARQLGKPHHLTKLPRVHGYLSEALHHPVFSDVAEETLASIPEPTAEIIEALT